MKLFILNFLRRGCVAFGFGPLVLASLYLILQHHADVQMLSVNEVCLGIFSLSALAFIAGGMNALYHIERLPLMAAILIHGCTLYISYLAVFLINGWLQSGAAPILVFTGVFVFGYFAVWAVIYSITKRNTVKLNEMLQEKQRRTE